MTWWGAVGFTLVGFFAYLIVGQLLPGLVIGVWLVVKAGGPPPQAELESMMVPFVPYLVFFGMLVAMVMVGLLGGMGWLARGPERKTRPIFAFLWVGVLTLVCLGGQQIISALQGWGGFEVKEQEIMTKAVSSGAGLAFYLAIALAAPLGEELVFRRFMFSTLLRAGGRPVAYVVSALLFALVHFHFPAFFLYLWMALCFTLAYDRTGTVWGAIGVHVFNNSIVVYGMATQGGG